MRRRRRKHQEEAHDGKTNLANCVFCGLGNGEIPKES